MPKTLPPVSPNENAARIMDAAWQLFQSQGYRGASLDEVCRACTITKPTLYYYFKDKETLFVQTLVRQLQGYRVLLEQTTPLFERLTELAATILSTYSVSMSALFRDMQHVHDRGYHRLINAAHRSELLDPLIAAMAQGLDRHVLRADSAEFYAWAYLGLVNTFVSDRRGAIADHQALAQQIVALFFGGAQAAPD